MTEVELAKKFMNALKNCEIFPEVPIGTKECDFVFVREGVVSAVEVKKNFNFEVLEQAFHHIGRAHHVYIAVPAGKTNKIYPGSFREALCKKFGIGVLMYFDPPKRIARGEEPQHVIQMVAPEFYLHPRLPELHEWMKRNIAGSTRVKKMTAFKFYMEQVTKYLQDRKEGVTAKQLFADVKNRYANPYSMSVSLRKLITFEVEAMKNIEYKDKKFFYKS
jgi:hypothetical protein